MTDQAEEQSVMDRLTAHMTNLTGLKDEQPERDLAPPEESPPDFEEIEYDGETFKIPPKLKDAFMKNADYTKKTQDLAEQRKRLDHSQELLKRSEMEKAFVHSVSAENQQLAVMEAYLAQASKVDWGKMSTDQMLRQKVELDQVREQRDALRDAIADKRGRFESELKDHIASLRTKTREAAASKITGFSDKTEAEVRAYALELGFSEGQVENILLHPGSFQGLWEGAQYRKIAANAGKAAATAEKVMRPGGASERMPEGKAAELNYRKAMKSAKTSGEKASVIEDRLAARFGGNRR